MEIRKYSSRYRAQCIEAFESNIGQYFDSSERAEFIEYLDALSESSEYYICLESGSGKLLGCGGIGLNSSVASLAWGLVHKDFHGQGIGTKLTDFRLSYIKHNISLDKVKIETSQHTQGFYEKRGFTVTKITPNGFGAGIDCVAMELDISR
ncbi:GNAT family N-acetyltransferase [Vibrio sp. 10N.261.46.A3]|uniref:GNAT family N-acetyltransferase n=1 Tax=Vibrio sp. 10N.261.46.A3 TaxID=3229658 RepID=UPI0035523F4C